MLSEKLKTHTAVNHLLLEKKLVTFMKQVKSAGEYATLLKLFYGYFGALEISINAHLDSRFLPDYTLRRKSAALLDDLGSLNAGRPELARSDRLPAINSHLQSIGALYVIEGSTLGGKFIAKMLAGQIGAADLQAFSFFQGYGEQSAVMWDVFKQAINKTHGKEDEAIIIETANQTFLKFSDWFDLQQPV